MTPWRTQVIGGLPPSPPLSRTRPWSSWWISLSTAPILAAPVSQSAPCLSLSSQTWVTLHFSTPGISPSQLQSQWAVVKPSAGTSLEGFLTEMSSWVLSPQPIHSRKFLQTRKQQTKLGVLLGQVLNKGDQITYSFEMFIPFILLKTP